VFVLPTALPSDRSGFKEQRYQIPAGQLIQLHVAAKTLTEQLVEVVGELK
jgi:hypothetical protein